MRSMTGFGRGTYSDEHVSVTIEMRAVNQRFLELNIRMPHAYLALEDKLRKSIKETLHRGKVDVYVTVGELTPAAPQIRIDYAALAACKAALDDVNQSLFGGEKTTLPLIMGLTKDWFVQEPPAVNAEEVWPVFAQALQGALDGMVAMRDKEGANIRRDLLARTDRMAAMIEAIEAKKEDVVARYKERLEKKILIQMRQNLDFYKSN